MTENNNGKTTMEYQYEHKSAKEEDHYRLQGNETKSTKDTV